MRITIQRPILSYGMMLTMMAIVAACSMPPERTQPVGRQHIAFDDPARSNWAGTGPRPLATTLWYPAAAGSAEGVWKIGPFRFGYSAVNAPFKDAQPRPLILLSHGTGGAASQLSWLAEALVQDGYLVAAVNHHGNTAAEPSQAPGGFVLPGERVRDLSVVLDFLLADTELGPRIDRQRIGAAGFSLGGFTVLNFAGVHLPPEQHFDKCDDAPDTPFCALPPEAGFTMADVRAQQKSDSVFQSASQRLAVPQSDSRIRAVFAMAPAMLTLVEPNPDNTGGPPVKVILSEHDTQVQLPATETSLKALLPNAEVQKLNGGSHYSYLAPCGFKGKLVLGSLCREPGGQSRQALHAEVARVAVAFFAEHLTGD